MQPISLVNIHISQINYVVQTLQEFPGVLLNGEMKTCEVLVLPHIRQASSMLL